MKELDKIIELGAKLLAESRTRVWQSHGGCHFRKTKKDLHSESERVGEYLLILDVAFGLGTRFVCWEILWRKAAELGLVVEDKNAPGGFRSASLNEKYYSEDLPIRGKP